MKKEKKHLLDPRLKKHPVIFVFLAYTFLNTTTLFVPFFTQITNVTEEYGNLDEM